MWATKHTDCCVWTCCIPGVPDFGLLGARELKRKQASALASLNLHKVFDQKSFKGKHDYLFRLNIYTFQMLLVLNYLVQSRNTELYISLMPEIQMK